MESSYSAIVLKALRENQGFIRPFLKRKAAEYKASNILESEFYPRLQSANQDLKNYIMGSYMKMQKDLGLTDVYGIEETGGIYSVSAPDNLQPKEGGTIYIDIEGLKNIENEIIEIKKEIALKQMEQSPFDFISIKTFSILDIIETLFNVQYSRWEKGFTPFATDCFNEKTVESRYLYTIKLYTDDVSLLGDERLFKDEFLHQLKANNLEAVRQLKTIRSKAVELNYFYNSKLSRDHELYEENKFVDDFLNRYELLNSCKNNEVQTDEYRAGAVIEQNKHVRYHTGLITISRYHIEKFYLESNSFVAGFHPDYTWGSKEFVLTNEDLANYCVKIIELSDKIINAHHNSPLATTQTVATEPQLQDNQMDNLADGTKPNKFGIDSKDGINGDDEQIELPINTPEPKLVKGFTINSNKADAALKSAYEVLIKSGCINGDWKDFKALFQGKEIQKKINWTGSPFDLRIFVKNIHNVENGGKTIVKKEKDHWDIVFNCFSGQTLEHNSKPLKKSNTQGAKRNSNNNEESIINACNAIFASME